DPTAERPLAYRLGGQRHRHALGVETGAQARDAQGPQRVAQELLLAAPDDLDRPADGLGQHDRLREGIAGSVEEMPAEEAAQRRRMQLDLMRLDTGDAGGDGLEDIGLLVLRPEIERAVIVEAG